MTPPITSGELFVQFLQEGHADLAASLLENAEDPAEFLRLFSPEAEAADSDEFRVIGFEGLGDSLGARGEWLKLSALLRTMPPPSGILSDSSDYYIQKLRSHIAGRIPPRLRALLKRDTPEANAYRTRMRQDPLLERWLRLQFTPETKEIGPNFSERYLEGQWVYVVGVLMRLGNFLNEAGPLPQSQREILKNLLDAMGLHFEKNPDETYRFVISSGQLKMWRKEEGEVLLAFLGELEKAGHIDDEDFSLYQKALRHAKFYLEELNRFEKDKKLVYTISLWERTEEEGLRLGLSPRALEDTSVQVLVVKNSDSEIVGGMVLRLFKNAGNGTYSILASFIPQKYTQFPRYPMEVQGEMMTLATSRIGLQIGAPLVIHANYGVDRLLWNTQVPYIPVSSPLETEAAIDWVRINAGHPLSKFFGTHLRSYEALRRTNGKIKGHVSPWMGETFPLDLENFARREIESDPDPAKVQEYLWGLMGDAGLGRGNGRSVDFCLGRDGVVTSDGTRWYHLNSIGCGATIAVRAGGETRDGKLPLEGAWRRFYLTNLMHAIAGPYGFRTSLGVSVTNYGRIRERGEKIPGVPQIEAKIDELVREQLRLMNLESANLETAGEMIDYAKEKVARELKKETMTREEYIHWLAKTLGEQFAIMEFFGFDHGEIEKSPQLGPWNVTLAGEIKDFDTGGLGLESKQGRYLNNFGVGNTHVDRLHIRQMEWGWRGGDKKIPKSWIAVLLYFAPQVAFDEMLYCAAKQKREKLRMSGINPQEKTREFNEKVWGSFIKRVRRNGRA